MTKQYKKCFKAGFTACPSCGKQACITIESRVNKDKTRRRRKECTECSARYTFFEVSEEFYRNAINNQKVIDQLTNALNLNFTNKSAYAVSNNTCDDCVHMRSNGCSFEFPDAGGDFADECSMFERGNK